MLVHCLYIIVKACSLYTHTHQTIGVKEAKHKDGIFLNKYTRAEGKFKNFFAKSIPVEYIKYSPENIISIII